MSNTSNMGATEASSETVEVRLSPYAETPDFYRTTVAVEGAKRWFEKSKVSVVLRDEDSIVLSMPKDYADKRAGISSLLVGRSVRRHPERPAERGVPERIDLQVGPAGRVVIPSVFRDAMQVKEGDRLMARVVDGELRLVTPPMAVRLAQKLVRETIPGDDSLADALIEERKREFEREISDGRGRP